MGDPPDDIIRQIEEAKLNVIFVDALENLAHANAGKTKDSMDFVPHEIPSHVVGVDAPFKRLKAFILASHDKDGPSHLGLHGRGGTGKTLLAQMLHNDKDIKEKYGVDSILWMTVGHDARVFNLYKTMAAYLGDEGFEKHYGHRSLKDQRAYLLNAFSKRRVFLVLDDVWQNDYEDQEMIYWLNIATAPGSATLLTTRNSSLVTKVDAESEVVLELSEEDSWKLFTYHAFEGGRRPSAVSEELAREVCKECKGLPFVIKVIGGVLLDKVKEEEWRCALLHLKRWQPIVGATVGDEIFGLLRLNYDMLKGDVLKTCFLYFAAFPENYAIPTWKLFDIWISEGLFGAVDAQSKAETHLKVLEKRSLIHWNHDLGYVQVDNIMRDLLLYIIDTAEVGECAYECFFQSGKTFKSFPSSRSLEAIKRMSFIKSTCEWPENFEAPNLRVLLLSESIDFGKEDRLPSFEGLTSLVYLDLSLNTLLEELPSNIGELKRLTTLDLSGCGFLKKLPASIGELKSLTTLNLTGCRSLNELPASIGELKSLTTLNLSECGSLNELPTSIGELKSLTTLVLSWCKFLKKLPASICELKSLTTLNLHDCGSLNELPSSIGELKSLTTLDLYMCGSLNELPASIGELKSLTTLNLIGCRSLNELPASIGKLKSLTTLNLSECGSLNELPTCIGELKSLTTLVLSWCKFLKKLPASICELKSLTTLNLHDCGSLNELPSSIGELKSLTTLDLYLCGSLKKLPASIGQLKNLTTLNLTSCRSLNELPTSIGDLKSLITLNLTGCRSLNELPTSIGELKSLTTLDLSLCKFLKKLPASIGELKSLTTLNLGLCGSLNELPTSIGELKSLTTLHLYLCGFLKLPASIGELKSLTTLNLIACVSLNELPASIGELKSLTTLKLKECGSLNELPASIGELKSLTTLNLSLCRSLKKLPASIGELKSLTTLNLSWCSSLNELPASIGELKSLTTLDLSRCESLSELPRSIGELKSLTTLNLSGCGSLNELPANIGELKSLTMLDLSRCGSLKKLPASIGELKSLTMLDLSRCGSLKKLPASIGELKSFTTLNLFGCKSLKELQGNNVELKWEMSYKDQNTKEKYGANSLLCNQALESNEGDVQCMQAVSSKDKFKHFHLDQFINIFADLFDVKSDEALIGILNEEIAKLKYIFALSQSDSMQNMLEVDKIDCLFHFNVKDEMFEFYFNNSHGMASIIGVGLEYAKVILEDERQLQIQEISKEDYDYAWENFISPSSLNFKVTIPQSSPACIQYGSDLLFDIARHFIFSTALSSLTSNVASHAENSTSASSSAPSTSQESNSTLSSGNSLGENIIKVIRGFMDDIFKQTFKTFKDTGGDPSPPRAGGRKERKVQLRLLAGGELHDEQGQPVNGADYDKTLLDQLEKAIETEMTFIFIHDVESGDKEIEVTVGPVKFMFDEGNEKNYSDTGRFGWYHQSCAVSFGVRDSNHAHRGAHLPLNVKREKRTTVTGSTTSTITTGQVGLNVGAPPSVANIGITGGLTRGSTCTGNVGNTDDREVVRTESGFEVYGDEFCRNPKVKYSYKFPEKLNMEHDKVNLGDLYSHPICRLVDAKFKTTWRPSPRGPDFATYNFKAERVVEMTNMKPSNVKGKGRIQRMIRTNKVGRDLGQIAALCFTQIHTKDLLVNHAMVNLGDKIQNLVECARLKCIIDEATGMAPTVPLVKDP